MRDKKEYSIYESLSSFKDGEATVFEEKRIFSDIILDNSDDQNKWINTIKEHL